MKNRFFILVASIFAVFVCSCSQDDNLPEKEYATVSFTTEVVSGEMTRTTVTDDITTALEAVMPQRYYICLQNLETSEVYDLYSDQSVSIPIGEYLVYGGSDTKPDVFIENIVMFATPPAQLNEEIINVKRGLNKYNLSATLHCFSIVWDRRTTETPRWGNTEIPHSTQGKFGFSFIQQNWDEGPLMLETSSTDGSFETKNWQIVNGQYGKFYFLNPFAEPSFGIDTEGWKEAFFWLEAFF